MFDGLQIGLSDGVQILILYIGVYALIRYIKGTRSAQVLLGFCVLVVSLLVFTKLFRFDVLARVVYFLLIYLALSMVVVFQQEIRRVLAWVGGQHLFNRNNHALRQESLPETLCRCALSLARARTGALIAVERGISLCSYEDSGVRLNALVSQELLVSIFTPPLPLHDGGIIVREGRIAAAHCLFPVSNQSELASSGMRHRAAVGLSEETDAVVIVVSEETGRVSAAYNGRLHTYSDDKADKLILRWLRVAMPNDRRRARSVLDWMLTRAARLVRRRAADAGRAAHAR